MLTPKTFANAWQNLSLAATAPLYLAISGGVDSVVLLDLLVKKGRAPVLLHVNYGLRPEAATETALVERLAAKFGLRCEVRYFSKTAAGAAFTEAAGRKFRYDFFAEMLRAAPGSILLTAHHADDLAETLLMKLTRGTRLNKLAFAPRQDFADGMLVRPLLPFSKADIYQYASYHALPFFEDASNADCHYARNRYRHDIIPRLKAENPQVVAHLAHLNEELLALSESPALPASTTLALNAQLSAPAFQAWLAAQKLSLPPRQLAQVTTWALSPTKQTSTFALPGGVLAASANALAWQPDASAPPADDAAPDPAPAAPVVTLTPNAWQALSAHEQIGCFAADFPLAWPARGTMHVIPLYGVPDFPLTCRHPLPGDKILLKKTGYTKKVSRYFIDQKIVKKMRAKTWLVTDSLKNTLWIVPEGKSYLSSILETDKMLYRLIYLKY